MPKIKPTPTPKPAASRLPTEQWLLGCIVVLAVSLRFFGLHSSITDWHSFRQADTASVTREYVKHGIDILHPTYHDLGNIQSGLYNPRGYRMVEFPIINALIAVFIRAVPALSLEVVSRLFSILASVGTLICIYFLGKRWGNQTIGFLSALTFASLPYIVYYSRVILPEPFFTFTLTFAVLSFDLWIEEKKWQWYVCSWLAVTLALLLKPFALFFVPIFLYLAIRAYKQRVFFQPALYGFLLTLIPLYLWRKWIQQYPEGIPASSWLFNGNGIRLRPAWFRWLGWERYTKMILGYTGVGAVIASIFGKNKLTELLIVWGASVLAYLVIIATGNVQHDYYQSITTPFIALAVGQGLWVIQNFFVQQKQSLMGIIACIALLLSAILFGRRAVIGFYRTRPDYEVAGAAVQRLTPIDAKVIAPAFSDTMFLYQTDRVGWTLSDHLDDKIKMGAQYYITTAYDDEAKLLEKKYATVEKTPDYLLLNLTATIATTSAK